MGGFHDVPELRFIQVRHEETPAFTACAHAKFTGEVGVCLATSSMATFSPALRKSTDSETTMGWLRNFLSLTTREEPAGLRLESSGHRELKGPTTFVELFRALDGWLPEASILYFESGYPDAEIEALMAEHGIPEQAHIALGTIWPRPRVFHVPATSETLRKLTDIMERHAEPQLAVHFHVYRDGAVMLEWHDAFSQPMLIVGSVPEDQVQVLVERFRGANARAR